MTVISYGYSGETSLPWHLLCVRATLRLSLSILWLEHVRVGSQTQDKWLTKVPISHIQVDLVISFSQNP